MRVRSQSEARIIERLLCVHRKDIDIYIIIDSNTQSIRLKRSRIIIIYIRCNILINQNDAKPGMLTVRLCIRNK